MLRFLPRYQHLSHRARMGALIVVAVGVVSALTAQTQPQLNALTVVRTDGQSKLSVTPANGRPMLSLEDLADTFQLAVREDAVAGGVTVSYKDKTIVLAPNQKLASVEGRVVSLSAAATRTGDTWLVPLDFLSRALAPIYDVPLDWRPASGLVIVGDVRVPRVAVRQETGEDVSKLVLEVTPSAKPTVELDGRRLIIRFAASIIDASLPAIDSDDYVQAVRVAKPASLVVELGRRFRTHRTTQASTTGGLEVTIDLAPAAPKAPRPSAPDPTARKPILPSPPGREAPPLVSQRRGVRTIVLDPGHGGEEVGARGVGGTQEKEVTLAVARQLKTLIENRLGLRVLLTRDGDHATALDRRAAFANNNKADVFVSLHANASVVPDVSGATVLYLSLDEYGPEAKSAALQAADAVPALGGDMRTIALVPWDLAQARHTDRSATLATLIDGSLRQQVPMSAKAPQQAPLRVLVGANMPAVLVEMGFLTNTKDEQRLRSKEFQTNLVRALYQAIEQFRTKVEAAGGQAE